MIMKTKHVKNTGRDGKLENDQGGGQRGNYYQGGHCPIAIVRPYLCTIKLGIQ